MFDKQGNSIAYFDVLVPPKSKVKTNPDEGQIPSKDDWEIPRVPPQKKKNMDGRNSDTHENLKKLIQRRKLNAPSIDNFDLPLVPVNERQKRTCRFCGMTDHTINNCVVFSSNDRSIVKDKDRPKGN